jgi:hypothetical protein
VDLEDGERRWQIPLLMTVALVLMLGSRFDATRAAEAVFVLLGFPVLALALALSPLRDSASSLRKAGLLLGSFALAATELRLLEAFAWTPGLLAEAARSKGLTWLLVALAAGGIALQAAASRRGIRTYAGAWVGMIAALAIYFPSYFTPGKETFGQVLAALLVALVVGGGPGLVAGALAVRLVKPR